MPSKKRKSPTESLRLDSATTEGVEADYRNLLDLLKSWRALYAHRRFTWIDRSLGRTEGFFSDVLRGHTSLSVERLLAFLALIGRSLADLAHALAPTQRIAPSLDTHYLDRHLPNRPREHEDLWQWAGEVEVSSTGPTVTIDHRLILDTLAENPEKGFRLAEKCLSLVSDLLPPKIASESANSFCWLLGTLAFLERDRGDHGRSAEWLGIASRLESSLEPRYDTRAFLYRACAYLLADLGQIHEAERCARAAVDLCLVAPSRDGLAESLFARALIVKWQGATRDALAFFEGLSPSLESSRPDLRHATRLQVAWLRLETGRLDEAAEILDSLVSLSDLPSKLRAHGLTARAVLFSKQGREADADKCFDEAHALFAEVGSAGDRAVLLLRQCRHRLRSGRELPDASLVLPLAGDMRRGSSGEAALLAVAKLLHEKKLGDAILRRAIEDLERPWAQNLGPRAAKGR